MASEHGKNTSRAALIVNLTGLGDRPTGAAAYAQFCASVAAEEFGAVVVRTPAWIERLPPVVASALRYVASARAVGRQEGMVYNPTYRAVPGRCGQIVTLLDLIPLRFPRMRPVMTRYFRSVLPRALARARGVIVLSRTMRDRVAETFPVARDRIHIVPPGVDSSRFVPAVSVPAAEPFLLAAGASLPHKNIPELLANADLWARRYRLRAIVCRHASGIAETSEQKCPILRPSSSSKSSAE